MRTRDGSRSPGPPPVTDANLKMERDALGRQARRLGESLQAVQARCRRLERAEGERRRAETEVVAWLNPYIS